MKQAENCFAALMKCNKINMEELLILEWLIKKILQLSRYFTGYDMFITNLVLRALMVIYPFMSSVLL